MGLTYGKAAVGNKVGHDFSIVANGTPVRSISAMVEWGMVGDSSVPVTLPDGTVIPAGVKYIRYGTVMYQLRAGGWGELYGSKWGPLAPSGDSPTNYPRGAVGILAKTAIEGNGLDEPVELIYGGLVYKDRLMGSDGDYVPGTGSAQVETLTVIVPTTVTTAGTINIAITGDYSHDPVTRMVNTVTPVTLTVGMTAADVALAIKAALEADSSLSEHAFTFTTSGADLIMTSPIGNIGPDPSLNIALTPVDAVGVTAVPTSANTAPGVAATEAFNFSEFETAFPQLRYVD